MYKTLQIKPKERPEKRSQLAIKSLEEPLKCDMEIPVTVQYTIAGETVESGYVTIVYLVGAEMKQNTAQIFFPPCSNFIHCFLFFCFFCQVLSREEIVYHGYENVEVKGSDGVVKGEVIFKVFVRTQMAPKMEFLAYCVPPSEIVLAVSRTFQIEKCLANKVCLLSS